MLRKAVGWGCFGVQFYVISITRGWVGVIFQGKKRYVTLEWPLYLVSMPGSGGKCVTCRGLHRHSLAHRGIRHRVLTNQRDRSYVYAVVSLAAGSHFVGGLIVTYIFSRVSVGSACVRVWKRDCDVTSLGEHRVKSLQQNGP